MAPAMPDPKQKLLTFLWRKNIEAYEVTVWEQDAASKLGEAPKFIPKGPITMTVPQGVKESSMGFCFGPSAPNELWMTARAFRDNYNSLLILKISRNLDVMSTIKVGGQYDYFARDEIVYHHGCTLFQSPGGNQTFAQAKEGETFEALHVKPDPISQEAKVWLSHDELQYPGERLVNFDIEDFRTGWVALKQKLPQQPSNQSLIHPGYRYPSIKYVYHSFVRGGDGHGCEVYLDGLQTQYLAEWTAQKSSIYWKTVQVQSLDTALPAMKAPLTRMIVTQAKGYYLLYIFLMDQSAPDGITYFSVRLRNDGSLDTHSTKIALEHRSTIQVKVNAESDFRVDILGGRVFVFYPQDWKVTGKSAPIWDDGVIKDEWSDFCDSDKRTPMVDSWYFGSVVVPDGMFVAPNENYVPLV
ncbi:hypothetical protein G7Z17_g1847 [Cylindrodendrum hubeiense]|uniref:Uncharacterized protein n=1 Tax=Cylindrodendrum hubeiense TaxID=595255 RepID=A0A9P5HHU8_9HYPO|nr:hypothetical protein G7Z17_g1847 [Cylindrodendrum hubeiense]